MTVSPAPGLRNDRSCLAKGTCLTTLDWVPRLCCEHVSIVPAGASSDQTRCPAVGLRDPALSGASVRHAAPRGRLVGGDAGRVRTARPVVTDGAALVSYTGTIVTAGTYSED